MKQTKKLLAVLRRYGVQIRADSAVVEHEVYRTRTEVTPLQFAVYEAAVKAAYLCQRHAREHVARHGDPPGVVTVMSSPEDFLAHYRAIAAKDGFDLPPFPSGVTWKQAAEDMRYCFRLIRGDGLYMALLD